MTRDTVIETVGPLLTAIGFKKRADGIFTIQLAKDVIGWLGLNRATQGRPPGEVEINPVIGIRYQEIERLVAELRGEKFHPYQPPTISTPLGYLSPAARYHAWVFRDDSLGDTAKEMTTAIAEYGLRFMRSMTTLTDLCRGLEKISGIEHQLVYRRPTAWVLVGDKKRAGDILDESLKAIVNRHDPAAAEFRHFATALRTRFVLS